MTKITVRVIVYCSMVVMSLLADSYGHAAARAEQESTVVQRVKQLPFYEKLWFKDSFCKRLRAIDRFQQHIQAVRDYSLAFNGLLDDKKNFDEADEKEMDQKERADALYSAFAVVDSKDCSLVHKGAGAHERSMALIPPQYTALVFAVASDDDVQVSQLMQENVPLKILISDGQQSDSLLILAAQKNSVKVAPLLIAAGVDITECDCEGISPLLHAAKEGHIEMVKIVLAAGAGIAADASDKGSAIAYLLNKYKFRAVTDNDYAIIKLLIMAGVDYSAIDIEHVHYPYSKMLSEAIALRSSVIPRDTDTGYDWEVYYDPVMCNDIDGMYKPLCNEENIHLLAQDCAAEIRSINRLCQHLHDIARMRRRFAGQKIKVNMQSAQEWAQIGLSNPAEKAAGRSALEDALRSKDLENIRRALFGIDGKTVLSGLDINAPLFDHYRATALACAAHNNLGAVVSLLLKCKADPNIQSGLGLMALHEAIGHGNWEMVRSLLDGKSRVDGTDKGQMTPLQKLVLADQMPEVTKLIIAEMLGVEGADCRGYVRVDGTIRSLEEHARFQGNHRLGDYLRKEAQNYGKAKKCDGAPPAEPFDDPDMPALEKIVEH